jgi:acyl-CoA dehydrogenase
MAQHARWARFADGADEVHQWRIAQRAIDAWSKTGSVSAAAGGLPI